MSMLPGEVDILTADCAEGADLVAMGRGCHFDYAAQVWRDGHDHAHLVGPDADSAGLVFCGADLATCQGPDVTCFDCETVEAAGLHEGHRVSVSA